MSMDISLQSHGMNIQEMSSKSVEGTSSTGEAEEVSAILGKDNVTISEEVGDKQDAANTNPAAELPELDEPQTKHQSIYDAIDKLVSLLQLENDEKQVESAKNRIESVTPLLEAERSNRAAKLVLLLSLMDSLGDRFFLTDFRRNEGASIAAFSAALMSMAPADKQDSVFAFTTAISRDAGESHWWFCGSFLNGDNNTLSRGLNAMNLGLDDFQMASLKRCISDGSFDTAAKICAGTPLADILGKAETFKEIAKSLADKFDIFGHFDSNKFLDESRTRALAKDLEEFAVKTAEQAEEDDSIEQLIESIQSNTSKTAEILAGMKGTDTEIAGQMNQMA